MLNSLSKPTKASASPSMILKKIWKVEADERYHVETLPNTDQTYIVLRTVSGVGSVELCGKNISLSEDTLLIFQYKDISVYKTMGDWWKFYWFEFECDLPAMPLNRILRVSPFPGELKLLDQCFLSLLGSTLEKAGHLSALFSVILMHWIEKTHEKENETERFVTDAITYIMDHINRPFTVAELADNMGISERYLRRLFKLQTGKSPREYISDLRLNMAKDMLLTGSFSVKEIAYSLGFQNSYYFSRFFKERTNQYPSEYRKEKREDQK